MCILSFVHPSVHPNGTMFSKHTMDVLPHYITHPINLQITILTSTL